MAETLGNMLRIEGFKTLVSQNGKTVQLLDTGKTFQALIQSIQSVDISSQLGADIRESNVIETLRDWLPSEILKEDAESQIPARVDGTTIKITKREDNLSNPFVRFEVVKILGIDT